MHPPFHYIDGDVDCLMNKAACWPPGGRALARASRAVAAAYQFSASNGRNEHGRLAFRRWRLYSQKMQRNEARTDNGTRNAVHAVSNIVFFHLKGLVAKWQTRQI